jgi:hypothetical protein
MVPGVVSTSLFVVPSKLPRAPLIVSPLIAAPEADTRLLPAPVETVSPVPPIPSAIVLLPVPTVMVLLPLPTVI